MIVNFDNDSLGKRYGKMYAEYFGTEPFFLPDGDKDITDFFKNHGKAETKTIIKMFLE